MITIPFINNALSPSLSLSLSILLSLMIVCGSGGRGGREEGGKGHGLAWLRLGGLAWLGLGSLAWLGLGAWHGLGWLGMLLEIMQLSALMPRMHECIYIEATLLGVEQQIRV